jgi:hypothetical protein
MGLLDRKNLLTKEELKVVKVELGNGDFVFVRQMTGRERDRFEQSLVKEIKDNRGTVISYERSLEDFRAKLAVVTICDDLGNTILNHTDYETLSQSMSAAKLEKIINEAQKLNQITEEDKENLVKNLGAAQSGNSTLDSASN